MKILVIGHLCHDVIHGADGSEVQSYGGISYAVATLASFLDPPDRVVPVFGVNREEHDDLIRSLSRYPSLDPAGIFPFDDPTNRVHLYYSEGGGRTECSKHIAHPIPFDRIRRHLPCNGILVNMVSGSDITLETLDQIRLAVRGQDVPLHFDFHSLTLGVNERHDRVRRPVDTWRRWAFMMDTVQLNTEEIAGLSAERLTEKQVAGHLLTLSVKGVLVTRGGDGVTLYYNDHKRIARHDVPGVTVPIPRDVTGCGDVFGAAFHLHYVRTRDLIASAEFANRAAAAKVSTAGLDGLETIKEVR